MSNLFFDQYTSQVDLIKKANPRAISNIYEDINTIKVMCEAFQTKLFLTPNCVLLFTLKHNAFYNCWYFAKDAAAFEFAFHLFLKTYTDIFPIRHMIVGKDENTIDMCHALNRIGCTLVSKLARNLCKSKESIIKMLRLEYTPSIIEFAKSNDAQEVFDLLNEEFDVYADNLPELTQIQENIEKQQVLIIRKDNKIALLHYFMVKQNIMYGYHELVRKEYRNEQLYFSLILFLKDYVDAKNIKRKYEWRNVTKKRLSKISVINVNEKAIIYINFYLYDTIKKR